MYQEVENKRHEYDDDAVCINCGFDGADAYHQRHNTWEGRADPKPDPSCPGNRRLA